MLRIIALLLLIPLFDIVLLVTVATRIGGPATVAIVVLTGLVGMLLVRAEGRHTVRKVKRRVANGQLPTDELLDGGLLIAAGAFLLTPGLVTDAVGLLLVLPPTRWPIRGALKRWFVVPYLDRKTGGIATGGVYAGGFPNQSADGGQDTYDVSAEEYDVSDSGSRREDRESSGE